MDEKSLAVRLTLNSDEATLNDAQIERRGASRGRRVDQASGCAFARLMLLR